MPRGRHEHQPSGRKHSPVETHLRLHILGKCPTYPVRETRSKQTPVKLFDRTRRIFAGVDLLKKKLESGVPFKRCFAAYGSRPNDAPSAISCEIPV